MYGEPIDTLDRVCKGRSRVAVSIGSGVGAKLNESKAKHSKYSNEFTRKAGALCQ